MYTTLLQKSKAVFILFTLFFSMTLSASISGTVYNDYNMNSKQDTGEPGIQGIVLKAYNSLETATATTNASGFFSLSTNAGEYRVEINNIPTYLHSTASTGILALSSVRPATFKENNGASGLTIGLYNPSEYVSDNAKVLGVTVVAGLKNLSTLKMYDYNETKHYNDTDNVTKLSYADQVGSTWGLAYDKNHKKAYASAALRRHLNVGPSGLGAIYVTDLNNPNFPTELFTTVINAGTVGSAAARNLTSATHMSHDPVYAQVGNMGLGDLDISEDGTKLYTINLKTQNLIKIDIATKLQSTYTIANPFGNDCPSDDVRSWGLEPHNDFLYIGSVCSSDVTVGSAVSQWNGSTFLTVIRTPLDFERENTYTGEDESNAEWKVWNNDYTIPYNGTVTASGRMVANTQPILADIEFTEDGGMVLGFIDRMSMLASSESLSPDTSDNLIYRRDSGGDIFRVCKVSGQYYNEGHTNCPKHNRYLDDAVAEYFIGDHHDYSNSYRLHDEIATGGLLYKKGSAAVATAAFDPMDQNYAIHRSGVLFLDLDTGKHLGDQLLSGEDIPGQSTDGLGKAGGMGDIELISDPAPIEIGNYVWSDLDSDGIQDPDEPSISDVTVKLYVGTTEVGSATTDANGYYYFGGPQNTNMHAGSSLKPVTSYALKIALNDPALTKKTPTLQNSTIDNRDNDGDNGVIDSASSTISFTTGNWGENDHDLDFGFKSFFDLALVKKLNLGSGLPGPLEPGDDLMFTITVINQGSLDATDITVNDYIPSGLLLNDSRWTQSGNIATRSFSSLGAGESTRLNIIFTIDPNFTGRCIINNAEIGAASGGTDVDSIPNNEDGTPPDTIDDDVDSIDGGDDYDLAEICLGTLFDLALTKKVRIQKAYRPGESITFDIAIFNQGEEEATDIQINDYIPTGLTLNDNAWKQSGTTATLKTPIASLAKGASTTVSITFKIDSNYQGNTITNNAEIRSAVGGTDIDSVPNSENGTTPDPQDNDTANTTGGDDYDPVLINIEHVFDLALIKKINTSVTPGPFEPGDNVTFSITVINQGTIDATNIQVNDYVPYGLSLNDSAWNRPGVTATLKTPIALLRGGTSRTVNITLKISDNFQGTSITNNAEIRYATGGTDIDSTPDNENGTSVDPQDNDTANTTGGDDYDPAVVSIGHSPDPSPTPTTGPTPTPTPTPGPTPSQPADIQTASITGDSVVLSWNDTSNNESGFAVYQNNVLVATLNANTTSYTVTGLDAGTTYTYSIRAISSSGSSAPLNITFTTADDYGWLPAVYHIILN